jgi:nucleotide-binding universal stress UspA family protein
VARTIVLGYDGSEGSRAALAAAVELASLEGALVAVCFAYEIPAAYGGETGEYRRVLHARAEQAAEEAAARLRAAGIEHVVELLPERPVNGLVHVAEKHQASMIVVGTNGEHPIKGVILGSVPHKLLHVSPVPVLVVPTAG